MKVAAKKGAGDDGAPPALDISSVDWGGAKLTDRQKLFICHYCLFGSPTWHNGARAARAAGYSAKSARATACKIAADNAALIDSIDKKNMGRSLEEAVKRVIRREVNRATIPGASFYKTESFTDENGREVVTMVPRPLGELTEDERDCVDNVDFRGQYGKAMYVLADAEKAMSRIQAWRDAESGGDGGYDVSMTLDGIRDKLVARMSIVRKNSELEAASGVADVPDGGVREEP